jgi:hypothetical protein
MRRKVVGTPIRVSTPRHRPPTAPAGEIIHVFN